jgi:hypothetical protein
MLNREAFIILITTISLRRLSSDSRYYCPRRATIEYSHPGQMHKRSKTCNRLLKIQRREKIIWVPSCALIKDGPRRLTHEWFMYVGSTSRVAEYSSSCVDKHINLIQTPDF